MPENKKLQFPQDRSWQLVRLPFARLILILILILSNNILDLDISAATCLILISSICLGDPNSSTAIGSRSKGWLFVGRVQGIAPT